MVKDCPEGGTNWRGSSHIRHDDLFDEYSTSYCAPHAVQIRRSSKVKRVVFDEVDMVDDMFAGVRRIASNALA